MNCKPGDLAIIVRHKDERGAAHLGKVIKVVSLSKYYEDCWETSPVLYVPYGAPIHWRDNHLRPLRGEPDATDTTHHVDVDKLIEDIVSGGSK
jgi:hypothetical protein